MHVYNNVNGKAITIFGLQWKMCVFEDTENVECYISMNVAFYVCISLTLCLYVAVIIVFFSVQSITMWYIPLLNRKFPFYRKQRTANGMNMKLCGVYYRLTWKI